MLSNVLLNQEIVLLHNRYDKGIVTIGTCNNGSIVGRIIRAENGNYTSHVHMMMVLLSL